jgi:hypothetical protein
VLAARGHQGESGGPGHMSGNKGGAMNLEGKRVFTGRMQLLNDWELRPFAIQSADGAFAPGLAARRHRAGEPGGQEFCFDERCTNKEEAFELAMTQGLGLLAES